MKAFANVKKVFDAPHIHLLGLRFVARKENQAESSLLSYPTNPRLWTQHLVLYQSATSGIFAVQRPELRPT